MPVNIQTAIDAVLRAGQEQRHWLERNPHPSLDATLAEAVVFYGGPRAALSLWSTVRAIEALRAAEALRLAQEAAAAMVAPTGAPDPSPAVLGAPGGRGVGADG